MKKSLKILLTFFLTWGLLAVISLAATARPFDIKEFPNVLFLIVLSFFFGPYMALYYPYELGTKLAIGIGLLISLLAIVCGILYWSKKYSKILLVLGVLAWTCIGLFWGLSTGT